MRRRDQNIPPGIEDIRELFNVYSEGPGCGVILGFYCVMMGMIGIRRSDGSLDLGHVEMTYG